MASKYEVNMLEEHWISGGVSSNIIFPHWQPINRDKGNMHNALDKVIVVTVSKSHTCMALLTLPPVVGTP